MGTPLDILFDRFISKVDEDLTGKEDLIIAVMDTAKSKIYKTCKHDLSYKIFDEILYDGEFDNDLDDDEIELWALQMLYEWNRREQQRLVKQKESVGTSDFNRLPNKSEQLKAVNAVMKTIQEDIDKLKDDFNTYKYD